VGATVSVSPEKHLWHATQGHGSNQYGQPDYVPTMGTQGQNAEAVQRSGERHQQKEGAGKVTMYAPTPERIRYARSSHCCQRYSPNDRSPMASEFLSSGNDHHDGGKPEYEKGKPRP